MFHEDMFEGVFTSSIWVKYGIDANGESFHTLDCYYLQIELSFAAPSPQAAPVDLTYKPISARKTLVAPDPVDRLIA